MSEMPRRRFMWMLLTTPIAAIIAACRGNSTTTPTTSPATAANMLPTDAIPTSASAATNAPTAISEGQTTLAPTPACDDDDDDPTIAQTEGPFYTPNNPERTSFLEDGITGSLLVVSGQVLSTDCTPIAGALVDFWHCDGAGVYDNDGFKLRGHQFADADGRYTLETILPGTYPGRTRHIHVKVQAPNQPVLTTQLYFPNEPDNATDGIFHPDLVMAITDEADRKLGAFDFVLTVG